MTHSYDPTGRRPPGPRAPGRSFWSRLGWRGRTAFAAAGLVSVALAGFAIATAVLFWRLADGPIALDSLEASIETFFDDEVGAARAEIDRVWLVNDGSKGIRVRLDRVRIFDAEGRLLVSAPEAAMGASLFSAVTGSLRPTSVELIGPHLRVRRHSDGNVELGFADPAPARLQSVAETPTPKSSAGTFVAEPRPPASGAPVPGGAPDTGERPALSPGKLVFGGPGGGAGFSGIDNLVVSKARLSVYDDATGGNWESFGAELRVSRQSGGLLVNVDAPFLTESGEWRIRAAVAQSEPGGTVAVDAVFDAVVPSEIAARAPELALLAGLDLPVTGEVSLAVSPDLSIHRLSADLAFGAGFVSSPAGSGVEIRPTLVDEGHVTVHYVEAERRLDIERAEVMVGGNRFRVSGTAAPEPGEGGGLAAVRFDLRSEGLRLQAEDLGRPPLDIRRALATGRLFADRSELEIETVSLEFGDGGAFAIGGNVGFGEARHARLRGRIDRLGIGSLLQLWPAHVAPGARAWIADSMPDGLVSEARIFVDASAEDLARSRAGQGLRNDAVQIEFALDGVTARYLGELPPIRRAHGTALLEGDRFRVTVRGGSVTTPSGQELTIDSGRFAIPSFSEEREAGHSTGEIDVSVVGPLSAALEVLDMEPLGWTREMGVDPARTGGSAEINIDLSLPMLSAVELAQTRIQAGARLSDIVAPGLFRNVGIEGGDLTIIATQRQIDADGQVRIAGIDSQLKWNATITPGGRRTDRISLEGEADAAALAAFGIDLGDYVSGPMPITLEAEGLGATIAEASIDADISRAVLAVDSLGWRKEAGTPGRLRLQIQRLDNEQVRLRNLRLEGKDLLLSGAIRLDPDGSLFKADLDRIRLGEVMDVALNGVRGADGVLRLKVRGSSLDSRAVLDGLFSSASEEDSGGGPVEVAFAIDSVRGRNATDIQDVSGTLRTNDGTLERLKLDGVFASGRPINVIYGRSGARPGVLNLKTADAGGFARLMGLYRRAHGGSLSLDARSDGKGGLEGIANARNFRVRDEPLFRQLGSAQGLVGAGDEVGFTELQLRFRTDGEQVNLQNAILNGPGMGARLDGVLNLNSDRVSVNGTFVPAYGLNSIPAGIPLVGWILTGRAGEGVVGMTFRVEGQMANPRIHVNPLSPLAPGILRSLFEFRGR